MNSLKKEFFKSENTDLCQRKEFCKDLLWIHFFILIFYAPFLGFSEGVYGRDIAGMHTPYYGLLAQSDGFLAMWNPLSHCGAPGLANFATHQLHPINLLAPWVEPLSLIRIYVYFHLLLFALGMRFWLRRLIDSPKLVLLGVLLSLFSFSTRSILEYGHMTPLGAYVWVPWLFGCTREIIRSVENQKPKSLAYSIVGIALLTGATLICGHAQFTHSALFICGAMLVLHTFLNRKFPVFKILAFFTSAVLIGVVMSWVQLHPTWESIPLSGRALSFGNEGFASEGSMNLATLIKSFFPWFWGLPGAYWGPFDFWFMPNYYGWIGLLGGLIFLLRVPKRPWWPLLILSGFFLILSFGDQAYLFTLYRKFVPGSSFFRVPGRFIYFSHLLALPLILKGVQVLWSSGSKIKWLSGLVTFQSLFFVPFVFFREHLLGFFNEVLPPHVSERLNLFGLTSSHSLLTFFVLELGALILITVYGLNFFRRGSWVVIGLSSLLMAAVHFYIPQSIVPEKVYEVQTLPDFKKDRVLVRDPKSFHNAHLIYGLSSPGGYDSLYLSSYRKFLDTLIPQNWSKHTREQIYDVDNPVYKWLNVGYVAKDPEQLRHGPEFWQKKECFGRYYLRASFDWPHREGSRYTSWVKEQQDKLQVELKKEGWDLENSGGALGEVKILSYTMEKVVLEVNCLRDALLASSENTYKDWRASVDGEKTPIKTWLGTFRSLPLKKGMHRVEFIFSRDELHRDLWISLFGFLLLPLLFYSVKRLNTTASSVVL